MSGKYAKLNVWGFGLALGIITAIWMFLLGLSAMWGYGVEYVRLVGTLYIGFVPTLLGSILGAIWGFIDTFIFGVIFAALYNCFVCKACKTCGGEEKENAPKIP
jgi:hypothetical protein